MQNNKCHLSFPEQNSEIVSSNITMLPKYCTNRKGHILVFVNHLPTHIRKNGTRHFEFLFTKKQKVVHSKQKSNLNGFIGC